MEFRKMVPITLYAKQKKRHRCMEQVFGLCGRRWGWDDLRELHRNIYIIKCETGRQSRLDARQVLRAGALGWPSGIGWGRRWEGGSGWGTHVNPWLIHVNVWQKPLKYCKVISLKLIQITGVRGEKKKKEWFEKEEKKRSYRYVTYKKKKMGLIFRIVCATYLFVGLPGIWLWWLF